MIVLFFFKSLRVVTPLAFVRGQGNVFQLDVRRRLLSLRQTTYCRVFSYLQLVALFLLPRAAILGDRAFLGLLVARPYDHNRMEQVTESWLPLMSYSIV